MEKTHLTKLENLTIASLIIGFVLGAVLTAISPADIKIFDFIFGSVFLLIGIVGVIAIMVGPNKTE